MGKHKENSAKKELLPRHHPGQHRSTVSLSFSLPKQMETPLNELAASLGMHRSELIARLVHLELKNRGIEVSMPVVPMRVRRGQQNPYTA